MAIHRPRLVTPPHHNETGETMQKTIIKPTNKIKKSISHTRKIALIASLVKSSTLA